ncbi:MAG: YolD-like family protein, partial [Clostridiales bacterium]|nr:YolD-like family protein [Clostridiales bacterium]
EAVEETARQTWEQIEPDEDQKEMINRMLQIVQKRIAEHPEIEVTYFEADQKKEGGRYVSKTASVKKIDEFRKNLVFQNGDIIHIRDILELNIPVK